MADLQSDIQEQLSDLDSELDLVATGADLAPSRCASSSTTPAGLDLALCERVTKHLGDLLADYSLEVSSPGPKYRRPSTLSDTKEPLQ